MPATTLSTRTLNRTLLARQHLLAPATIPVEEALEHLVGLQAQVPTSPYLALRARIAAFDPSSLEALVTARRAVRMVLMRATIHLVTTRDAAALRPVFQPVLDAELFRNPTWARGLVGVDLDAVLESGRALVEERPRSLAELRAALEGGLTPVQAASAAYAVRNRLPTVQPTPRGLLSTSGDARLTTLEAWTGSAVSLDADPAPVLRRYLAAFGPASVADMQAWSRLTGLREVVERMRPMLRVWRDDRGRELLDLPDAPIAGPDAPAPVRFLPDFDNVLLGHADRSRILGDLATSRAAETIGRPSFLVDGFVAGRWRLEKAARGASPGVVVEPLAPLSPDDAAAVAAEAEELAAFLATAGPRPVVRIDPPASG